MDAVKRWVLGTLVAFAGIGALGGVMVPVRTCQMLLRVVWGSSYGSEARNVRVVWGSSYGSEARNVRVVWGSSYGSEARNVRVDADRIRRKPGPAGDMARTQPGVGCQLVKVAA